MKDWLNVFRKGARPTFVVGAQNDAMAVGARGVLEQWARTRPEFRTLPIRVIGSDGSPGFGQRLVIEGKLTATVIMPPTAGRAVDELASLGAGSNTRSPAEITLAPTSFPDLRMLAGRAASAPG